jgi:nitrite reductase (NADH) small subunit
MPLIKVAKIGDIPPGQVIEAEAGDRTVALCNVDGKFYCVDNVCPHIGGPLGQGALQGEILVCPWHGWEFNCVTGANVEDEDMAVDRFTVIVEADDVLVDVPES